jgi:hypothetical protein
MRIVEPDRVIGGFLLRVAAGLEHEWPVGLPTPAVLRASGSRLPHPERADTIPTQPSP